MFYSFPGLAFVAVWFFVSSVAFRGQCPQLLALSFAFGALSNTSTTSTLCVWDPVCVCVCMCGRKINVKPFLYSLGGGSRQISQLHFFSMKKRLDLQKFHLPSLSV